MRKPSPNLYMFATGGSANLRRKILLGTLVGLCLCLIATQAIFPQTQQILHDIVMRPLQLTLRTMLVPVSTVNTWIDNGAKFFTLRERLDLLERENDRYRYLDAKVEQLEIENALLRKLTEFTTHDAIDFVSARVISDTRGPFGRALLVAVGRNNGVRSGQGAMIGNALAGMVVWVGPNASRILLLDDVNAMTPVLSRFRRHPAIARGTGTPRLLTLELTDTSQFAVGQPLVTSGAGGVLPANIPVAVITAIENGNVYARLLADTRHVDLVTVVNYGLSGLLESGPPQSGLVHASP